MRAALPTPIATLQQVVITEQLKSRRARVTDQAALNQSLVNLGAQLARAPYDAFQCLVEEAMKMCRAHTVGMSILEGELFRWSALTGHFSKSLGASMPRSPSPCGTVLDSDALQLMSRPELYFEFPGPVDPPIVEVLLLPFYSHGRAVGTIWAMAHDDTVKFDLADVHILTELCGFASTAFDTLASLNYEPGRAAPSTQSGARGRAPAVRADS